MRVKQLKLSNFRGVRQLDLQFQNQLTVVAGINGSGKSTILDALSTLLSWLINRIQRQNSSGRHISDESIYYNQPFARVGIKVEHGQENFTWELTKTSAGSSSEQKSQLTGVSSLARDLRDEYHLKGSLPIAAYFPVNRTVSETIPDASGNQSIDTFDVYENALGTKTNFQAFFEWFRIQDDIVNERQSSRNDWYYRNRDWIVEETSKLLDDLTDIWTSLSGEVNYSMSVRKFKDSFGKRLYKTDPQNIIREFTEVAYQLGYDFPNIIFPRRLFRDIDYLSYRLSDIVEINEKFSEKDFPLYEFVDIFKNLDMHLNLDLSIDKSHPKLLPKYYVFIINMLFFITRLSLWWITAAGQTDLGNAFLQFREKVLNEKTKKDSLRYQNSKIIKSSEELAETVRQIIERDISRKKKASSGEGRELMFVRKAIECFLPNYNNLRVKRSPKPHMLIDKHNEPLNLDYLSDGEKNLIVLVGDIARRLALANSDLENPLEGHGIILIDEIELHLHPAWQRMVISRLLKTFPNCQFIVTTHSPQVLGEVEPNSITVLYTDEDRNIKSFHPEQSIGLTSNEIMDEIMKPVDVEHTLARNAEIESRLSTINSLIDKGTKTSFKKAKAEINRLVKKIHGTTPDIVRAQSLIAMLEPEDEI